MSTTQKFVRFIVGLAVVFAVAVGLGSVVGPDVGQTPEHSEGRGEPSSVAAGDAATTDTAATDAPAAESTEGLSATAGGYTLDIANATEIAGTEVPLRFRIVDATGAPLTRYVENHDKQLHLIVVRRDMAGFQHVHPTLDDTGTWAVPVDFTSAGDYRVFADFIPEGATGLVLGADVRVAGRYDPQPLPPPTTTTVVDGYTVTLRGDPRAGTASTLTLSVSRDGRPVTDLQPYLGAYGHLVTLRSSDLAYLHNHPTGGPADGATAAGPDIGFHTTFPTPGDYRMFLDFQHRGVVRTAEFTVSVPVSSATSPAPGTNPAPATHGH
jgi:hypothetical protein